MIIKRIKKAFGKRVILNDISMEFSEGLNFIIGDSGEGKSTLLNILGALDSCDDGEISFCKFNISSEFQGIEGYRSDVLGFVFQESNLINGLTVWENIDIAASMSSKPKSQLEIQELLKRFNIYELKDVAVDNLSGGEKQRVSLVRALAKNAKVILADEPTGSLDSENTDVIFEYLKIISESHIVIVITHNKDKAFQYGDAVYELKQGKLISLKENEFKQKECENFKCGDNKKQVISNKYIMKLTRNSIKKHRGKFISMALTLAVVSMLCASTYLLKTCVKENMDELNYTYYDLDEIDVYSSDFSKLYDLTSVISGAGNDGFSDEELKRIQENELFAATVPFSDNNIYSENDFDEIDVKPIVINEYFAERIMSEHVEGNFPKSNTEVIIGEDLANSLFEGKAIGKEWKLRDDYGNEFQVKIVGINHQKNVDGIYYNYFSSDILLGKVRQPYSYANKIYIKSPLDEQNKMVTEDAVGFAVYELSKGEVVYGDTTYDSGEIIVSKKTFCELYTNITGKGISLGEVDFESVADEINIVFNENYLISGNNVYETKIVGVHNGVDEEILISEQFYNEINEILPTVVQCYVKELDVLEALKDEKTIDGFSFYSYYSDRFETVVSNNRILNALFVILVILTLGIFAMVINSFVKVALEDKYHEVGIMKSLGARVKDIYKILVCDNFILGIVSGLLAVIFYVIFALVLPVLADLEINNWLIFGIILIILFISPCALSMVLCSLKIKKVVIEKPIETLKRNK